MALRVLRIVTMLAVVGLLVVHANSTTNTVRALTYSQLNKIQQRILSGFAFQELNPGNTVSPRVNAQTPLTVSAPNYTPSSTGGCPQSLGPNTKVNQDCLNISDPDLQGRGQAQNETAIAQDPNNPIHLVAGYNDYRRGDGNCGSSYSLDGGHTWHDAPVPMSFTRGSAFGAPRQYWQAGGDPSVAWDTKGNVYFDCQMFNRGSPPTTNPDTSSAIYVFRSTGNNGASWNFPARPVIESPNVSGTAPAPFEDKPYMTVDDHVGSPFQDRIYVTWTEFSADGSAYIWESHSSDYGEHFSQPVLVSGNSPLCTVTFGAGTPHGNCNENQFSQPFTGPDGALYVVFDNFNNATSSASDNHNQILLAKSTDGGNSFSAPVLVANYYDLPDCATYQGGKDFGRACVPEKDSTMNSYFRAANYPSGAVNPNNPHQIAVTFGSYINPHSNERNGCVPAGTSPFTGNNLYLGVKTPGACNNDILVSVSNDGGATFTGTTTDPRQLTSVNQDPAQATTDQFWQWAAFNRNGDFVVSYFDRQYGNDEMTGYSDITLSESRSLLFFGSHRVTSSSMPPPTEFSGTFYGDYTGLSAVDLSAYPIWMDTRNPDLFICSGTGTAGNPPTLCTSPAANAPIANDQDVFTGVEKAPAR
jgi:hypothetical protein